jgi:hypothetical protein
MVGLGPGYKLPVLPRYLNLTGFENLLGFLSGAYK